MQEINEIKKSEYDLNGDLYLETNIGKIKLSSKCALEIAYVLADSLNLPYSKLNDLEEKFIERNI